METTTFSLGTREEVAKFEELLYQYIETRAQVALKHISLVSAYDRLSRRVEDGSRIFTALLDIQINFVLLYLDIHAVGATWNANFSKGKLEGGSILDSQAKFSGKMDIHRFYSSYILRYRALWDKLMGLLVLAESPKEYEAFASAKSKKSSFVKIAARSPTIPKDFAHIIEEQLPEFDDRFRTAEAHGTGVLRKYSFTMDSMVDNPQVELLEYWNLLIQSVARIGQMFGSESTVGTGGTPIIPPSTQECQ